MQEVKLEQPSKSAKENKDNQDSKKKTSSNEKAWNWQPIATDLAITIAKGVISGFALSLGSKLHEQAFNRRSHSSSLKVIDGGKTSVAI